MQMIPEFEAECVKEARARGVTLPPGWSAQVLLEELRKEMMDVSDAVIKMAARLRQNGLQKSLPVSSEHNYSTVYFDTPAYYCM